MYKIKIQEYREKVQTRVLVYNQELLDGIGSRLSTDMQEN